MPGISHLTNAKLSNKFDKWLVVAGFMPCTVTTAAILEKA
jgi:hypothetical protein